MPSILADSAIACAWLPEENATTPALRCAASNRDRALKALALEEDPRAEFLVEDARGDHRRPVRVPLDAARGRDHVVEGRKLLHEDILSSSDERQRAAPPGAP
jgi:hypothetical protein